MTDWNYNPTMRKLGYLCPVTADTPEGQEVVELVNGMLASDNGKIDVFELAVYAYVLGVAKGKQVDRKRRAKKTVSGQEVTV